MTKPDCVNYYEGYCIKGIAGTKCEIEGCVAYVSKEEEKDDTGRSIEES